eukprot:gene1462-2792_t
MGGGDSKLYDSKCDNCKSVVTIKSFGAMRQQQYQGPKAEWLQAMAGSRATPSRLLPRQASPRQGTASLSGLPGPALEGARAGFPSAGQAGIVSLSGNHPAQEEDDDFAPPNATPPLTQGHRGKPVFGLSSAMCSKAQAEYMYEKYKDYPDIGLPICHGCMAKPCSHCKSKAPATHHCTGMRKKWVNELPGSTTHGPQLCGKPICLK